VDRVALWTDWRCGPTGAVDRLALWTDWRCGPAGAVDRLALWSYFTLKFLDVSAMTLPSFMLTSYIRKV
jgi:hypothetical protein